MDRHGQGLQRRQPNKALIAIVATVVGVAGLGVGAVLLFGTAPDGTQQQPPASTVLSFAVLAGNTVNNTGPSVITGDLGGAKTGNAITGFPPGVVNGTQHPGDALALEAQADLTTAYYDAANRTADGVLPADIGGLTLGPGVYQQSAPLGLTGTLTLDGNSDPAALFIIQAGETLVTTPSSGVTLVNGAQACNVFWQVGSSVTLSASTTFIGSILANTSISVQTGTTVEGRVLARSGDVDLDSNLITSPACESAAGDGIAATGAIPKPGGGETGIVTTTDPSTADSIKTDTYSGSSTTTSRSTTGASVPTVTTDPTTTNPTTTTTTTTTTDPTTTNPTTTTTTTTTTITTTDPPPVPPPGGP